MSNTLVQATAEGLSTPDREISPLERMQSMASAWMNATPEAREHALAASRTSGHEEVTALMTHQSPLSLAIQQHHKALAELDALGLAQVAAEEAHIAANRTDPQLAEAFEAADAAFNEACSRQSNAHEAVLSAPVLTLRDMQVKAAHLADTIQHTIHDASTMRKLLASVTQPTDEDGDSIESMYSEWSALFTRDASGETDEQAKSTHAVFEALQSRIISAPARSPRDVAMQFMADTHNNGSEPSNEFTEALARLAMAPVDLAPIVSAYQPFPAAVRLSAPRSCSLQDLDHGAAATLPTFDSTLALSLVVNDLFGAYVAIEREQDRLAKAGLEEKADALGGPALEAQGRVLALRDRSANPDLIAARVMAELMLLHNWRRVEAGEAIDWSHEDREIALPLIEAVADRTTGTVREHTRLALATIGVEIEPEVADPMLVLIGKYLVHWNAANAAETDDEETAIVCGSAMGGLFDQLANSPPSPTSIAGAAAAVRLVRDESNGSYSPELIRNVLTVVADALGGPLASAPLAGADPLLALVTEYRTQLDAFNASPRTLSPAEDAALEEKTWGPPYAVLMGGEVPNATTLPGVLAALRELHREFVDCGGADEMAIAMLPAIVAFFDKDAAQKMTDHKIHTLGS